MSFCGFKMTNGRFWTHSVKNHPPLRKGLYYYYYYYYYYATATATATVTTATTTATTTTTTTPPHPISWELASRAKS